MMTYRIVHQTRYTYSDPVYLEPQYLKFKPLGRAHVNLKSFKLKVSPVPDISSEIIDNQGNYVNQIWIKNATGKLKIKAMMDVETYPFNPFDFLVDPVFSIHAGTVPYGRIRADFLNVFLDHTPDSAMKSFTADCKKECSDNVITFFTILVDKVYQNWNHVESHDPSPLNASACFQKQTGSCRDLAWMLMALLRSEGFATRFVSGYTLNQLSGGGHELHAWVETLLPGAGWIGMDPSSGLFADQNYLPVATGYDASHTMPVTGNYRGLSESDLKTTIDIREI